MITTGEQLQLNECRKRSPRMSPHLSPALAAVRLECPAATVFFLSVQHTMTKIIQRPYNQQALETLIAQGISAPVARALAARGIEKADELAVEWKGMLPPAMLEGTAEAAERLALARERGEQVTIVADFDCDGATACSLAVLGLTEMGLKVNYIVPNRVTQGYGLSREIVDIIAAGTPKTGLIVTVDNGITSVNAVAHARELGIDVIVTDHHLPGEVEPDAYCIVNPNRKGSAFPSKNLAGVGVMFYVLMQLRAHLREKGVYTPQTQPRLDKLVDLVALGTVADVVRLDRNNRILVAQGLKKVRAGAAHPGIEALFQVAGKSSRTANVRDFGFVIGPRINAAGRLSSMESGIECLLSKSEHSALNFARELNLYNTERRELESEMQQIAEDALAQFDPEKQCSLCLFDDTFNEGVVGLVASRIKDRIHRPVFAFAPGENNLLKGSGRSIPGIHLRDTLDLVSRELEGAIVRFGGHAAAAGLTIRREALGDFRRVLESVINTSCDKSHFERVIYTDGGLAPHDINEGLISTIEEGIWGQGFEAPLFSDTFRVVHQNILKEAHLKLRLELGGQLFDGIFFRHNTPLPEFVTLAYRPNINEYMGQRRIQLVIEAADES